VTKRCFADIQPLTSLAHRPYHEMHVRMRLICVQRKCISVLQRELIRDQPRTAFTNLSGGVPGGVEKMML
jgi:hypothetical protein